VNRQQEIIYLPTTTAFNADIKILEVNLRKVAVGMPARVIVDAMQGKVFSGKVAQIAPVPDSDRWYTNPNLKVYSTVIALDSKDPALRNGMSCRVEIVVQRHDDVVYVPIQAVTRVNRQPTVYVVENGVLVPQPVEIGLDNSRFVHVFDGLQAGEVICLAPPLAASAAARGDSESEEETADPNHAGGRS